MSKNRYTLSDKRLIQAVVDKDLQEFEIVLANPDCTRIGVYRALYLSASMGMPEFCDMIFHEGIKQAYVNGCLICAIMKKDDVLFRLSIDEGADVHHDNEMPLQVAVSSLNRDYTKILTAMGCDIEKAFPPDTLKSLFLRANSELNSREILSIVSTIKQNAPDATRNQGRGGSVLKLP